MTAEVKEGSAPAETPGPESTAEARAHARESVTQAALPASVPFTERVQKAGHVISAALDKPGSLIHAQPPTFKQARDRHHQCARHYRAVLLRWPRLLWGYLHLLLVKPVLNFLEWVTESPARFFVAVSIIAVIIWS